MAGQLPADRRMSHRALGALLLATLVVATAGGAWAWWRAWSAPRVAVVLRPTYSVEGISTGTPVRVNGVVVGQVESLGLRPDAEGRLRPEVRLTIDPSDLEDRGFADRLRRDRLSEEVARGLRARLITVSPASGLLQVELLWEEPGPPPAGLASDEIPAAGGSKQRALERVARARLRGLRRSGQESRLVRRRPDLHPTVAQLRLSRRRQGTRGRPLAKRRGVEIRLHLSGYRAPHP